MTNRPSYGFSISIFFPDGTSDGLRIVEKSNWIGRCVVCPRAKFVDSKIRPEFERTGVYVLAGPAQDGNLPTIYIGEGDPVRPRLEDHYAKKDFWTQLIFFISKDDNLTKTHVQYLESRLVALSKDAKRSDLDNGNTPQLPSISEREQHWMERFLEEMLLIYPVLGVSVFEKPSEAPPSTVILELKAKGVVAFGYESAQGFVVKKGSQAVLDKDVAVSTHQFMKEMRQSLVKSGVFVPNGNTFLMAEDYTFSSPSTAAGVLLGRSANGRIEWKDSEGRTLKDIQAAAVGSTG
jgi:hypothetical protein